MNAKTDTEQLVDQSYQRYLKDFEQVEKMLDEAHERGATKLSFEELVFCREKLDWDEKQADRQFRRRPRIQNFQGQAGTRKERDGLRKNLEAAEETLNTEGAAIRKQIEQLTGELTAMEETANRWRRMLQHAEQAVESLRSLAPDFMVKMISLKRGRLKMQQADEIGDLQAEVQFLQRIAEPIPDRNVDGMRYRDYCRMVHDYEPSFASIDNLTEAWPARRQQLLKTLPDKKAELEAIQARYATQIDELQRMKDFYVR